MGNGMDKKGVSNILQVIWGGHNVIHQGEGLIVSSIFEWIVPGLFLGNFRDAKDIEKLAENKITHVVALHDNAKPLLEHLTYKCIQVADSPEEDLMPYFEECIDFIHDCRTNNGCCLVHCIAGVSRSTTIVSAYLMAITSLDWRDTLRAIRVIRMVANPNYGFKQQLQDFYNKDLPKVKTKLQIRYPNLDFTGEEDAYLKSLLAKDKDSPVRNVSASDDEDDVLNFYRERQRKKAEGEEETSKNDQNKELGSSQDVGDSYS